MNIKTKMALFIWLVAVGFAPNNTQTTDSVKTATVDLSEPYFFKSDNPSEHLLSALEYYEIEYPRIVRAQAILETGHFKSNVCISYNNLFGLYDSRKGDYYMFDHWSESVEAYKKYIQYKYKGGDYYAFLDNIGYAEDPDYIKKLKVIVGSHKL